MKLQAEGEEIGATDWSSQHLVTCSDSGVVRSWRPDVDVYNDCLDQPVSSRWYWYWASSEDCISDNK